MKKILEKIKGWSLFKKIAVIYVILLAVVITGICIWEWSALADYEADNEAAKKSSNPDLFISKYVEEFTVEKYKSIISESLEESGNLFYSTQTLVDYILSDYKVGSISSVKNEKWTESRPAYDIYSGEELLLTLTLGVKSKNDFGYNVWKEGQIKLATELVYDEKVSFIADSNMKAYINGVEVTSDYISSDVNSDAVSERLATLAGEEYKLSVYNINNLLDNYELKVTDSVGNELTYTEKDGVRDYSIKVEESAKDAIEDRVVATMEAYAKIINKVINRTNMTNYFHPDGPMYEVFRSQQFKDSMYWNFAAKSIDFVREEVTDIRLISDDIMVCNIDFEANKTYDRKYNVNENLLHEVFSGEAVFVKKDGKWYLDTLKLQ